MQEFKTGGYCPYCLKGKDKCDCIQQQLNNAMPPALKQADVMCCKELLAQMLKEENEALGKLHFEQTYKREKHANQKYCLAIVLQMIEQRKSL